MNKVVIGLLFEDVLVRNVVLVAGWNQSHSEDMMLFWARDTGSTLTRAIDEGRVHG